MSDSKRVNTANLRPFKKGFDPRRNKGGNLNAEAQAYEIRFRNALAKGLAPKDFADIVIEDVRRHRPGAKEFYADRLMGRVTQPVSGNMTMDGKLIVEFVETRG
jgi:hypothetical protein